MPEDSLSGPRESASTSMGKSRLLGLLLDRLIQEVEAEAHARETPAQRRQREIDEFWESLPEADHA